MCLKTTHPGTHSMKHALTCFPARLGVLSKIVCTHNLCVLHCTSSMFFGTERVMITYIVSDYALENKAPQSNLF